MAKEELEGEVQAAGRRAPEAGAAGARRRRASHTHTHTHTLTHTHTHTHTHASTMCVHDSVCIAGGFYGDMVAVRCPGEHG